MTRPGAGPRRDPSERVWPGSTRSSGRAARDAPGRKRRARADRAPRRGRGSAGARSPAATSSTLAAQGVRRERGRRARRPRPRRRGRRARSRAARASSPASSTASPRSARAWAVARRASPTATDVAGFAEAFTGGDDLVFAADDRQFLAFDCARRAVADDDPCTAHAYVAALEAAAAGAARPGPAAPTPRPAPARQATSRPTCAGVAGKPVLVIGLGPVGRAAAARLVALGAERARLRARRGAPGGSRGGAAGHARSRWPTVLSRSRLVLDATPTPDLIDDDWLGGDGIVCSPGLPPGVTAAAGPGAGRAARARAARPGRGRDGRRGPHRELRPGGPVVPTRASCPTPPFCRAPADALALEVARGVDRKDQRGL